MAFRIPKEEYINRTFRLRKELVDRMETICNDKNISLNKLTVLCIEYALDNLEEDEPHTETTSCSKHTPKASAPGQDGGWSTARTTTEGTSLLWRSPCDSPSDD